MENYKTLIILDWDDTLFPTSWISKNNINLLDQTVQNKYIVFFSRLDNLLYQMINTMIKFGKVIIITNATKKWIQISSEMLPHTQKIINRYITVISAKDTHEKDYPMQSNIWKKISFRETITEHFKNHKYQNIISVGDAEHEFNAMTDLYDIMSLTKKRLLKTVRFMRDPSFENLIDQLEVLDKTSLKIIKSNKHMDLTFNEKS